MDETGRRQIPSTRHENLRGHRKPTGRQTHRQSHKDSRTHLADTDFTMSEVAYKVGISPKQFAKFFKDEYGFLPSKYV